MNQLRLLLIFGPLFFFLDCAGQPTYSSLDVTKPAKYENRTLGAEKTDTKNFKKPRHFIQNTITHYNYYFNANVKINEILMRAKAQHRDDYTKLLSFYDYDLNTTAKDRRELDSVIYKATTGILNHDLRNDWIDNLYLLMGKAYYFSNKLDSAHITFQYINYVFAPKEEGGYQKPIGSNADLEQGGQALTVSTAEKLNVLKKTFSLPPSRNDAFIWQVKTLIAKNSMGQASSLIEILKHDPMFPQRLQNDLAEVQAWWYYQQRIDDSATIYLEKALPNAGDREERARWEYLIAQLYERLKEPAKAQEYYGKVIQHTYNPVLEVYARLNYIRQNQGDDDKLIQRNIEAMESMARKERYADYRDIIYYTAAQIELEHGNRPAGVNFLLKSTRSALPTSEIRNKAFLQLGNLAYYDRRYRPARNYYDSVTITNPEAIDSFDLFRDRRKTLDKIITALDVIAVQDSLQKVAALSAADRDAYIKKLVKLFRKKRGLKEEDDYTSGANFTNTGGSMFGSAPDNAEWYFNNSSLKSRGFNDFKAKWGNRPNVDNWFLSSLVAQAQKQIIAKRDADQGAGGNGKAGPPVEVTFNSLQDNLPLTPEKLKKSNDTIENALFVIAKLFQEGLPDYYSAINGYDSLLKRFPRTARREDALFNLYYCYKKIGDDANANRVLEMMKQEFPGGKFTKIIINPDEAMNPDALTKIQATKRYEDIYTAFIEGRFEEAIAKKKTADSLYGDKYWTPQLLFIESVYLIHDEQDSAAKVVLNHIIMRYAGTPMAEKAKTFLDVLSRRKQIEDYLTHLQVVRAKEDSTVTYNDRSTPRIADTSQFRKAIADTQLIAKSKNDLRTLTVSRQKPSETVQNLSTKIKIDNIQLTKIKANASQLAMLQHQVDSINNASKKAQSDSLSRVQAQVKMDSLQKVMQRLKADSTQLVKKLQSQQSVFAFTPDSPQNVAVLITKVDPVYVTETRNAFNRYNRENFYNQPMNITNIPISDSVKLVVISGFENSETAVQYLNKARQLAPREIIPWLPPAKYSLIIISNDNLERLKINKDIVEYWRFLSAFYPGKF